MFSKTIFTGNKLWYNNNAGNKSKNQDKGENMSTPQKILIEFFDLDYLDNIIAPICEKYDRIIYIRRNDPKQTLRRSRDAHSRFLSKRTNAVPEFMIVEPYDYQRMIKVLEEITDAENDFTFDITGGTNLFIAGAGDFIARHPDVKAEVIFFDLEKGLLSSSNPQLSNAPFVLPKLSVEEVIQIHNADLMPQQDGFIRYNVRDPKLNSEIMRIWNIMKTMPKEWNNFFAISRTITREKTRQPDGGYVKNSYCKVTDYVPMHLKKDHGAIVNKLIRNNILTNYIIELDSVSYHLHIPECAEVLFKKSGNILELYTYLAAFECGIFTDVTTGVLLDWDGVKDYSQRNTNNEADLLCVSNCIPFFISCKNTVVTNAHLYELDALARHYCGKYAVKVFISTVESSVSIVSRAEDMNIKLIDNVQAVSHQDFLKKLAALAPVKKKAKKHVSK